MEKLQSLTIEEILVREIDTKFGKKNKIGIKAKEDGKIYGAFENYTNKKWKAGDVVKVKTFTNIGADGKTYYNYKVYSEIDELRDRITALETVVFSKELFKDEAEESEDLQF